MRTFWDFVKADVQITARNRQALFWTFFFPVLLMFLLGVVFGQSGSFTTKLAIVNQDKSAMSGAMVAVFEKVDALKVSSVASESQAVKSLKNGDYAAVLVLPAGLQQNLARGATPLPFFYDNTSLAQAGTVTLVTQQVVNAFAEQASGSQPKFELASQGIASSSFNYISFLVPGVVAMALMTNGIYGVSGTFVAYRQRGVLRRLKATPMPLPSFIGSRVLVHLFLALIQAALVIAVGVLAFHVHMAPGPTLAAHGGPRPDRLGQLRVDRLLRGLDIEERRSGRGAGPGDRHADDVPLGYLLSDGQRSGLDPARGQGHAVVLPCQCHA